MKYILKETTPRQNNIELPIAFLITDTHKEYISLYRKRKTIKERLFSQKKTTQHYNEWFTQRDDTKIPFDITPLHHWFAVPGINISKDYWENFSYYIRNQHSRSTFTQKHFTKKNLHQYVKEDIQSEFTGPHPHQISRKPYHFCHQLPT